MKIAVCDDENMVLEEVKVHIEEIAQQLGVVVEIHNNTRHGNPLLLSKRMSVVLSKIIVFYVDIHC